MTRDEKVEFLKERYGLSSDEQLAKKLGKEARKSIHDYKSMSNSSMSSIIDLAIEHELLKEEYNEIMSIPNIEAIINLIKDSQDKTTLKHKEKQNSYESNIYINVSQVSELFNIFRDRIDKKIRSGELEADIKARPQKFKLSTVEQKLINCGLLKGEKN